MKIGKWQVTDRIVIDEVPIEEVEDFCYLGSVMSSNSSCDKEIKIRMGKANAVFGRLERIWKINGCSIDTKVGYMSSYIAEHTTIRSRDMVDHSSKRQETGGAQHITDG